MMLHLKKKKPKGRGIRRRRRRTIIIDEPNPIIYKLKELHHDTKFIEDGHTYEYKGERVACSATQSIPKLGFEKFDALAVAKRKDFFNYQWWLDKWEKERHAGVIMHKLFEAKYEMEMGYRVEPIIHPYDLTREMRNFQKYESMSTPVVWMQPEQCISYGTVIAGQIDYIGVTASNKVIIKDWKRTKFSTYEKPLEFGSIFDGVLTDCKHDRYRLQVNLYAKILREYGVKVDEMRVVRFYEGYCQEMRMEFIDDKLMTQALAKIVTLKEEGSWS
ncbi:MAG: hypothetical protein ACTSUE_03985 [Promethearchaeota archaeon]